MNKIINIFQSHYKTFYIGLLIITAVALPHSRALLSSAQILLAAIWLLEADFKRKFKQLKERKSVLILSSIFFLHIIGLIYTTDFNYAFNDIKVKMPLVLFPIIIGTSYTLSFKELKLIILAFVLSILLKTFYGFAGLFNLIELGIDNIHDLSGKFSHIRYGLMLNIAVFSLAWLTFCVKIKEKRVNKIIYIILIIWLSVFLLILQSVTGWIIFIFAGFFTIFFLILKSKSKILKIVSIIGTIIFISWIIIFLTNSFSRYNFTNEVAADKLETYTKSGNQYLHDLTNKDRENGNFVYLYICNIEIKDEWNKISKIKIDSIDFKEQNIRYTLIRYLTSKGLRKDKEGINKLTTEDIKNIEQGLTNYIFENRYSLYAKIYEILWQIEKYKDGKNPEGHSVTQRLEFLKVGFKIVKDHMVLGVGTGDIKLAYEEKYIETNSQLSEEYRLRAHNQFLTICIAFGLLGFIWFLFAYIYPGIFEKKFKNYLFTVIFIILSLSMLNEDTLETQMGVSIFAFFYSFYLFTSVEQKS